MTTHGFVAVIALGLLAQSVIGATVPSGRAQRQAQRAERDAARQAGGASSKPKPAAKTPPGAVKPANPPSPAPLLSAANPYEAPNLSLPATRIDELVEARWTKLGITPAHPCSDAVFVRRVYLDVIGTLPTALEAREFLMDRNPNKRKLLIDRLLARDEYADYWSMKWCDVLRVKAEFPINLWPNAVQTYHKWIHTCLRENLPYDQFARALLTTSGSNFRDPPVNFYRAVQNKTPEGIAHAVALTFMGERADQWPRERLDGLAAFFTKVGFKSTTEWKEEIVYFDPSLQPTQRLAGVQLMFPDGTCALPKPEEDPRLVLANWLVAPKNPWFARNMANRAWAWLLGRGITHEPDDARPDNPPVNPELLAYLEKELIAANYDLKQLYRLVLNSRTYQRAAIPVTKSAQAEANFAHYPMRRLEAEVLIDALNQITSTTEKYSSPIPEPFTFIPENQRSITLADGSTTSSFLELFGRPPRDTGLESERNNRFTAAQRLHLLNSSHIQRKLEQSRMVQYQLQGSKPMREIISNLYLGILSRWPTDQELRAVEAHGQTSGLKPREIAVDLSWALINSAEFLHRH